MATKKKTLEQKILTDMETYFQLTSWAELWEEWFLRVGVDGRPYYKTITKFAEEKRKSTAQGHFLHWLIGPRNEDDPRNELYPFALAKGAPWDWAKKRQEGGWLTPEALKTLSKTVRISIGPFEELRELGNDTTLPQIYRLEQYRQDIDKEFLGRLFVDGVSWKENQDRASFLLHFMERLNKLSESALRQHALTRGINFDDMSGFLQLVSGVKLMQSAEQKASQAENLFNEVNKMMLKKAVVYDLDMPKALEESLETAKALLPEAEDPDKNKIH